MTRDNYKCFEKEVLKVKNKYHENDKKLWI